MYHSIADIIRQSEEKSCPFWQIVLQADMEERGVSYETSFATMRHMYQAMKAADAGYDPTIHSASGMAGGAGEKLHVYNAKGANLCGELVGQVMEKAIKMGESNACMHRIVAAPTAGSCGVIPAVFRGVEERLSLPEEKMVEAMFVSAGIGAVIAENASLAGASGGCQAEIGSASAMAAGGLAYLQGGSAEQIADAAAFALKNMLGLACDPVGGLVEVPCIKRNVVGAVNALTSAQLAMAGITSAIPVDEVIDAMRRIGNEMPSAIKETSLGGLATSPTAVRLTEK